MSGRLTKRSKEPGIILLRGADPYGWRRKRIVFGEIRKGGAVPPPCTMFSFRGRRHGDILVRRQEQGRVVAGDRGHCRHSCKSLEVGRGAVWHNGIRNLLPAGAELAGYDVSDPPADSISGRRRLAIGSRPVAHRGGAPMTACCLADRMAAQCSSDGLEKRNDKRPRFSPADSLAGSF
jgi:hypothetical protein